MTVDLRTTWLGIEIQNPLVAGAGPLTGSLETLQRLEEAGVGAVVLPSLFEEQIEHEDLEVDRLYEEFEISPEASSWLPELTRYNTGPSGYVEHLEAARKALRIPVVASLNGHSPGGWVHYAQILEDHGAQALELNVYYVPTDPDENAVAVEDRYVRIVSQVRAQTAIPLAVKLGPYFSALPNLVSRLQDAGADGVLLFNRFLHPDIRLDALEVVPWLELSAPAEALLALRWIALLKDRIPISLAATGGVETADEVIKLVLAGADAVQSVSSLIRHGPEHARRLLSGVREWMEGEGYDSLEQMKGSLCRGRSPDPGAFERANYMRALTNFAGGFR